MRIRRMAATVITAGTLTAVTLAGSAPAHAYSATMFRNEFSNGRCLAISGTTDWSQVIAAVCDPGDSRQRWNFTFTNATDDPHYMMWSNQATGNTLCLDGNGSSAYVHTCDRSNPYQAWTNYWPMWGGEPFRQLATGDYLGQYMGNTFFQTSDVGPSTEWYQSF